MDKESILVGGAALVALLFLSSSRRASLSQTTPAGRLPLTGSRYLTPYGTLSGTPATVAATGSLLSSATSSFATLYKLFQTPSPAQQPYVLPDILPSPPSYDFLGLGSPTTLPDILTNYNPPLPVFTGAAPAVYDASYATVAPDIGMGIGGSVI